MRPGPVLLTIPHAGRAAPPGMDALLRVPTERLLPLEDRHVDRLADAVRDLVEVRVQPLPRAWIDLNRREDELDPSMIAGRWDSGPLVATAKMRGGLGLVPRRLPTVGEIWRAPLAAADVRARIAAVHRPWHAGIAAALEERRAHHGWALLLDLHSMPPGAGADIVIGDLYGRSAAPSFVTTAAEAVRKLGFVVALNRPYAGGHTLERHGRPDAGIHALQIEVSRTLYLAPDLSTPDVGGVSRMGAMLRALVLALGTATETDLPLAAE